MKERALITGASSGIGLALAWEFASHGHELILTAPVEQELKRIAAEIEGKHKVNVEYVAQDLEADDAAQNIFAAATRNGRRIDILVNNAGLGHKGNFWEIPLQKDLSMIRVNIEAVISLTKIFLPSMLNRKSGRILNTASIAGFEPGPLLAVYHATKAFILSFTEAIATELKDTGVSVTALCPGATDTDFFPKAEMMDTKIFQKGKVMAPQEVAEGGYAALMKGDRVYVAGAANKALVFSRRFMSESAQARMNQNFYEDVEPGEHKRERGDIEAGKNN